MEKDSSFASERLRYRGIARQDAELIVEWRSDPDNYRHFFSARPVTLEEHLRWFEGYLDDKTRFDFVIIDPSGERIGTVGVSHVGEDSCEVNYMIGAKGARGKGYAREAVEAMTKIAFEEMGLSCVEARIMPNNEASMRVAESAGFAECERVYRCFRDGR